MKTPVRKLFLIGLITTNLLCISLIAAAAGYVSFLNARADLAYEKFSRLGRCSYLVHGKFYADCGSTDPRLIFGSNEPDELLSLAEAGLKAELARPRSSRARIDTYQNVIEKNTTPPPAIKMRTGNDISRDI